MDIDYLLALQDLRESWFGVTDGFFTFITDTAVGFYPVLIGLIIFWVINKKIGVSALLSYGLAIFCTELLKTTFCVYRPWIISDAINPPSDIKSGATGYSFPSGHSTSASSLYTSLILWVRKKHVGLCVVFASIIALTMFSRNYFTVHTPQDVLVGATVGILSALIIYWIINKVEKHKNLDIRIWVLIMAICAIAIVYITFKTFPMDYINGNLIEDGNKIRLGAYKDIGIFIGIATGWLIEKRFINFKIKGNNLDKLFCGLVGGILFILSYCIVKSSVSLFAIDALYVAFYALLIITFMTLYPWIYYKCKK